MPLTHRIRGFIGSPVLSLRAGRRPYFPDPPTFASR